MKYSRHRKSGRRMSKFHQKDHVVKAALIFGFVGILMAALILFVLMVIDSAFNIKENYVSDLVNGDYGRIFKITLFATIFVLVISLPALFQTIEQSKARLIVPIIKTLTFITLLFLIPIGIFDTKSTQTLTIFGITLIETDLHRFFAEKMFVFALSVIFFFLLADIFPKIKSKGEIQKAVGWGYIVLGTNIFLMILVEYTEDIDADLTNLLYVANFLIYIWYFVYLLIAASRYAEIKKIPLSVVLLLVLLVADFIVIYAYQSVGYIEYFINGSILTTNQPVNVIEIVFIFNLFFVMGYIFFRRIKPELFDR